MKNLLACLLLVSFAVFAISCREEEPRESTSDATEQIEQPHPATPVKPLYAFELNDIAGGPVKLAEYRGKVLLLVNVASKCGYTKQYEGLQALYERYAQEGLVVLGFPANNFGAQEPGTNAEIQAFCTTTFGVTFPMFGKISVKGDDIHPLYKFLTDPASNPGFSGDIKWNFNKFLVDREGNVVGRYGSSVEPLGDALTADIEKALAQTAG